jgi:hypothetical protein
VNFAELDRKIWCRGSPAQDLTGLEDAALAAAIVAD